MKKNLLYTALLIVCISFFSFREIGQCNVEKCIPEKTMTVTADKEWSLSPFYNLLKI